MSCIYAHFSFLATQENYKDLLSDINELKKNIDMVKDQPMFLAQCKRINFNK
jgi:hypothetical protein